jgi:hypothetical protein
MRKLFIALAFALVLLVPPAPAPTRAGTFTFQIPAPVIGLIETDPAVTEILALACVSSLDGSGPWLAALAADNLVDGGYTGESATVKDKPDKFKAKWSDKAKDAATEEILHLDVTAGAGTTAGAKATLKARATDYVIDPEGKSDFGGTGKLRVKDKSNKEKLIMNANIAVKVTEGACSLSFDETGKAVSARLDGVNLNGRPIRLGTGR